jgi:hypothetical protein
VDLFRGRGRSDPASAESPHVGATRPYPGGGGVGQGFGPGLDRRTGLCPARSPQQIHLPGPGVHRGRKGERRSFAEADYAALLDAAHQQLGGPIVVIWTI